MLSVWAGAVAGRSHNAGITKSPIPRIRRDRPIREIKVGMRVVGVYIMGTPGS
jgi:hypothetical protein